MNWPIPGLTPHLHMLRMDPKQQIQETQGIPSRINAKKIMPDTSSSDVRTTKFFFLDLNSTQKKKITRYRKGNNYLNNCWFLLRNHEEQKTAHCLFLTIKVKRKRSCQPRIPYLVKISFRNDSERKIFSHEGEIGGFVTKKTVQREVIKGLQAER